MSFSSPSDHLAEGFGNIEDVSLDVLREELVGSRTIAVKEALMQGIMSKARTGSHSSSLVDRQSIPDPLLQDDASSCQTFAIVNGIRAVKGAEYLRQWGIIRQIIDRIRIMAREAGDDALSMNAVARQFPQFGVPLMHEFANPNPIRWAWQLFHADTFMGHMSSSEFHGVCYIPFSDPSEEGLLMKLDSRKGSEVITLEQFYHLAISMSPFDNFIIFRLG